MYAAALFIINSNQISLKSRPTGLMVLKRHVKGCGFGSSALWKKAV